MGNWQLEVGKMALYLAMPVGAFYAYNQVSQKKLIITGMAASYHYNCTDAGM